jgi:hypothetical protein
MGCDYTRKHVIVLSAFPHGKIEYMINNPWIIEGHRI